MKTSKEIVRNWGWLTRAVTIPAGADFRVATDAPGISGIIGWLESHSVPAAAAGWPFPFPVYREDVDADTACRARRIMRNAGRS